MALLIQNIVFSVVVQSTVIQFVMYILKCVWLAVR